MAVSAIPVLWVCGPPGVGKTAVAWELFTRLRRAGAEPAYLDVDQVGICYPSPAGDPERHGLKIRNVAALRGSFAVAGARGLVVSGVTDPDSGPDIDVLGGGDVTVCRLRVDAAELVLRLDGRVGSFARVHDARRESERLDRSTFADWSLDTTGLAVAEVGDRLLATIGGWPRPASPEDEAVVEAGVDAGPGLGAGAGAGRGPRRVLWLSGPTGVGKSTVGFQVYRRVLGSGAQAAYLDMDQLGFCAATPADPGLGPRNLTALAAGFGAAGADALVVVGPIAGRAEALHYEAALPAATFTWCRLHAGSDELTRRILTRREHGGWPQPGDPLRGRPTDELLAVARRAVADAAALERRGHGLRVDVDDLSPERAAASILSLVHWS